MIYDCLHSRYKVFLLPGWKSRALDRIATALDANSQVRSRRVTLQPEERLILLQFLKTKTCWGCLSREEIAMMIRTVLRRRDDVWASLKTGCLSLRRLCVGIRWRYPADVAGYDLRGLSLCLRMRILILLLEKKLLLHSVSVKSGFAKLLTKSEARLLRRVLVSCARGSKQEPCYFELLYYRIRQCCQTDDITASYTLLCAHGMSIAGDDQRVLLVDELLSRIPAHILDAPFQKFICWTCHKQCDPCCVCSADALRYCGGCKLARYCSASCQRLDWNLHKRRCTSFLTIAQPFLTTPNHS